MGFDWNIKARHEHFMSIFMCFNHRHEYKCAPTHPHTLSLSLFSHPLPLSLLVEQNDDQLGVHLVSVLTERQITPLKRHIHQVPGEGNIDEGDRERDSLRHLSPTDNTFGRGSSITFLVQLLNSRKHNILLCVSLFFKRLSCQTNTLTLHKCLICQKAPVKV